jgi:hypothetical protein
VVGVTVALLLRLKGLSVIGEVQKGVRSFSKRSTFLCIGNFPGLLHSGRYAIAYRVAPLYVKGYNNPARAEEADDAPF